MSNFVIRVKILYDDSIAITIDGFHFSLIQIEKTILIAVNQEYIGTDQTVQLKAGDEIAVIPPISGG